MKWILRHRRFWPLLYICLLLIVSVIPVGAGTQDVLMNNYTLSIRWDYIIHLLVYVPLPVLVFWGFRPESVIRIGGLVSLLLVIPAAFEFVQMPLPYRFLNINDLVANEVGVVLGMVIYVVLLRRFL